MNAEHHSFTEGTYMVSYETFLGIYRKPMSIINWLNQSVNNNQWSLEDTKKYGKGISL